MDYFVTVDISPLAVIGSSFTLTVLPLVVAPDVESITGSTITFSMAGGIADLPDTVHLTFSDIASRSLYIGTNNNKLAMLSFRTESDAAYLTGLKLDFTGVDKTDIPLVKLYRDTVGNGFFDPAYDVLAASAVITAGSADLYLPGAGDLVNTSTRSYFVTVDVVNDASSEGRTLSAGISNENSVFVAGVDVVYPFSGQNTAPSTIQNPLIPTPPVISIYSADGQLYPEITDSFNAYRTLLKFKWSSMALQGSVGDVYYYIGQSSATLATPAGSWQDAGAGGDVSVKGLNLLNDNVYYISVKVKNTVGAYYSDIVSKRFVVDTVVPAIPPNSVTVSDEGSDLVVNWDDAVTGISGLSHYVVEERNGNSPLWVAVSTTSSNFLVINGGGTRASSISRTPGTYFYRIYAVNNAGIAGAASLPLTVNVQLDSLGVISDVSVYPNPFDSRKRSGTIAFTLNADNQVKASIYDIFGGKVKGFNLAGTAGANSITWDGTDASGQKVSKGMYLCVLEVAGKKTVLKIGVVH